MLWRQRRADGSWPTISIGLSVYSPPFANLYTYSNSERDLGNSRTVAEFFQHYQYLIAEIPRDCTGPQYLRYMSSRIAAMLERDGYIWYQRFRGDVIRAYEAAGWIYDGEVCIDKDPQAQAIRTKAKGADVCAAPQGQLLGRPALADYILKFHKPGTNPRPFSRMSAMKSGFSGRARCGNLRDRRGRHVAIHYGARCRR